MQSATQQTLANLVEAHITALIRESATVNRHSRRGGQFSAADEISTSKSNNNNNQGGRQKRRRLIHHDDINMALQWRGSEKLYVSGISIPVVTSDEGDDTSPNNKKSKKDNNKSSNSNALSQLLQNTTSSTTANVSSLLKGSHIPRIDLNAYLQSELVVPPPSELGMTVHWLAVEGVMPNIPLNEVWNQPSTTGSNSAVLNNGSVDPLAPLLQIDSTPSSSSSNETDIQIRELQHRLLSEELQLYYTRITTTLEHSNDVHELTTTLNGIRCDGGIQELVPFLSRYIAAGLVQKRNGSGSSSVEYCRRLIQLFDGMLDNPNLHLDLQLHQLLSPVGTCIVAKRLGTKTKEEEEEDDHWSLREIAAQTLVKACNMYGMQYGTMKPRVMKLLTVQALRVDRPLVTQYGGIRGITLFGARAIDAFILPVARDYWEYWEGELHSLSLQEGNKRDGRRREYELHMCQQALLDAIAVFLKEVSAGEQARRVDWESFSEVFGERLIPLQTEVTEYMSVVI